MGEVYRALDTRLEREVALKLVSDVYLGVGTGSASPSPATPTPHGTPSSGVSHERFLREARSAATLNHPNVCSIHDTGEQDGRPYLVMELLRGETLKQYLARSGGKGLSPAEVILFSQQATAALSAARRNGIIHRDIKPANLFVVEGERGKRLIKILDFGLAKKQFNGASANTHTFDLPPSSSDETAVGAAMELTTPGAAVGTVAYMSPEQAKGEPLDARTDLFSLGSVIYEMATGKAPFAGGSTAEVFAALLRETPPPVSSLNPAMPRKLDAIVARLLAKDPEQRYANADTLQEALDALDVQPAGTNPTASATANKRIWVLAVACSLLLAAGLAWWKLRPAPAVTPAATPLAAAPDAAKNSVILADFINHTGDPVFETTLNQALQIELEQSPVISIVSQQHLAQSVKFLGKPEGTPVTPAIAREIGVREGVKAILTGTIASLGKQYVLTLAAQNTATGDDIVSEQAQAADKEHVLEALGKAAAAMRLKLGEDLASIKKLDTPFGQATTTSLEAFRAYALGDKAHEKAEDIPEAESHYLRAIALDPNFAMAYARLGVVYANSGQTAKAHKYFDRAYALSSRVSEGERLYIQGHYYLQVTGSIPKVVETLQEGIQTYPTQISNFINICVAYTMVGQFDKALPFAQKAMELDPGDSIAAENLLTAYIALGRMNEARTELNRELTNGLGKSTSENAIRMVAFFLLGEPEEITRSMAVVAGRPDEFVAVQNVALIQMSTGQYAKADDIVTRVYDLAGRGKAPDVQANILTTQVLGRGLAGLCDGSEATLQRAQALDKTKVTQMNLMLAAAVCGEGKLALPLIASLDKSYPDDTLIQTIYIPLTKGFLALSEGRLQQAVDEAEPAKSADALYPASYLQGLAYLQKHDPTRARSAFASAMKPVGATLVSGLPPFYAQAQLGLARAYALGGDKSKAKQAYDAFFETWKNADADLPMLLAARKEYATL